MTLSWHSGPGGTWLVYGPWNELVDNASVEVERRDGTTEIVEIEHVTRRFSDGMAYGHPVGLAHRGDPTVKQVKQAHHRSKRQTLRPRGEAARTFKRRTARRQSR